MSKNKIRWDSALIEWESCGLSDIPTGNLLDFLHALSTELLTRENILDDCDASEVLK